MAEKIIHTAGRNALMSSCITDSSLVFHLQWLEAVSDEEYGRLK